MISGSAVNIVFAQETTEKELIKMMVILIPIILIILFLTTSSWFEPVLFLSTIGIAIIINSGTNLILGEISFVHGFPIFYISICKQNSVIYGSSKLNRTNY